MDKLAKKLSRGGRGAPVRSLHRALLGLGYATPENERSEGSFGPGTERALAEFQKRKGLPSTGTLNPQTARALIGDAKRTEREVHFSGRILMNGDPVSKARVALVQSREEKPLTTAGTDSQGRFTLGSLAKPIRLDSFDNASIELSDHQGNVIMRLALPMMREGDFLVIDVAPFKAAGIVDGASIAGVVRFKDGRPAKGSAVTLFKKALRDEEPLAQTETDSDGSYWLIFPAGPDLSKVGLQVRAAYEGEESRSPLLHGVAGEERIDLTLGGELRGTSDFDIITAAAAPVLGPLKPSELVETDDNKDFSYLAEQLNIPLAKLLRYGAAHRMAEMTALSAPHLYALLASDTIGQVSAETFDGTQEEINLMLKGKQGIALTEAELETLADELRRAGKLNRIAPSSNAQIDETLAKLENLRKQAAGAEPYRRGKASLQDLLTLTKTPAKLREAFIAAYARTGDTKDSLEALEGGFTAGRLAKLELVLETGDMAQNHLPLVALLLKATGNKPEKLRAMARNSHADWVEFLSKLSKEERVPENILASADDLEAATNIFAETLRQRFTKRYPREALAGELRRPDAKDVLPLQERTALVLERATDLDLIKTNIPVYLSEHGAELLKDVQQPEQVAQNLMAIQRVTRLAPTAEIATRLLEDGLSSARRVRDLGRQQFLRAYADSGVMERSNAFTVLRRADLSDAAATALLGNLQAEHEGFGFGGVAKKGDSSAVANAAAKAAAMQEIETILPSYRTLFGSTDFCECQHCRSVLSPAAYLADTLRFLSLRSVSGSSDSAKDRLLARRPDIGEILLNCKNTNTPLPYIDLVNELLEAWVAPGHSPMAADRQTTRDATDLRLLPEYSNAQAYDRLKTSIFPLGAPFDVDHAEALPLLDAHKTTHLQLLETLDRGNGSEWVALGISAAERDVILGSASQGWRYWGLAQSSNSVPHPQTPDDPSTNITGHWLAVLRHVPSFLHRAGLSYKALLRLLQTRWMERFDARIEMVDPTLTECNTDNMRLVGAGADFFHAAQIFLRLMCALKLSIPELDRLLASLGIGAVNQNYLNRLGAAVTIMRDLKMDAAEVAALHADIDTHIYEEIGEGADWQRIGSTYERVFARPDVDPDGTIFPADPAAMRGSLTDATTSLMSALGISESALGELRRAMGLRDVEGGTPRPLSLTALSRLYRASVLTKALGLTAGIFADMVYFYDDSFWGGPLDIRRFLSMLAKYEDAGFELGKLAELVVVKADDLLVAPVAEADIESFVSAMQIAQKSVRDMAETGATPEERLAALLPLWPGLTAPDDLETALGIVTDTYSGGAAERAAFLERVFADLPGATEIATELGPVALPDGPARDAAIEARQSWLAEQITRFKLREMTRQSLADFLPAAADLAEVLMTGITVPGASSPVLETLLKPDIAEPDAADPLNFAHAAKRDELPAVFDAIELVARAAHVAAALSMSADDCLWLLKHAPAHSLLRLDRLPTLSNPGVAHVINMSRTLDLFRFSRDMARGEIRLIELLDTAMAGSSVADLEAMFADVMALEPGDVAALAQIAGMTTTGAYLDSARYDTVRRTVGRATRMSATAAQLDDWAVTEFDASRVKALRDTLRAHLGESRWADKGAQLQDMLRNAKRDALVNYLIANPTGGTPVFSADDIYDHLLIDAETDACVITSRIKQAMSAVQLFVQRCMFAIEPDIDTSEDHDEAWGQWVWMKNYRVWEANRKVFLYPENWIEPELRLDKSPLFKMLEEELTQAPVTRETAEKAIAHYLDRLSEVARLEVVAHYYESDGGKKLLHVFGRSHTTPRVYVHRTHDFTKGLWSAWQQLDIEIESDHLIPVVWNRRMQLFWPRFTTELVPEHESVTSSDTLDSADPYVRIQLMHSELRGGVWSAARQLDGNFLRMNHQPESTFHFKAIKTRSSDLPGRHDLSIRVGITSSTQLDVYDPSAAEDEVPYIVGDFLFQGRVDRPKIRNDITVNPAIAYDIRGDSTDYPLSQTSLVSPRTSHYRRQHFSSNRATDVPTTMDVLQSSRSTINNLTVFAQAQPPFEITVPHQFTQFGADTPFFYQDAAKSYFVQPIDYYWNGAYFTTQMAYPTSATTRKTNFLFQNFAHPFVDAFQRELDSDGIEGLYRRSVQTEPWDLPGTGSMFDFDERYDPTRLVDKPYPVEDVDFSQAGAYAIYNWELFFHTPFFIANQLSTNQRFEEAMEFYHLIFNPMGREAGDVPQRFWVTRPFFEATGSQIAEQRIQNILLAVSRGDPDMIRQIAAWRENPFEPHLIASMRPAVYQKSIVFKYIRNMLDWGDQLFRRDSIESINEATQVYLIAAAILGVPPERVPSMTPDTELSYNALEASFDDFSNALLEVENLVGGTTPSTGATGGAPMPRLEYFYFCVPSNDRLSQYRDIVTDRLFKIRNSMNIDGVKRTLALFEPPIDPAALVKAFASGGGVGDVLGALSAKRPHYRFSNTIALAYSIATETERLGAELLRALQNRDAEALAVMRNSHVQSLRKQTIDIYDIRIQEAELQRDSLIKNREAVDARRGYYDGLSNWNGAEIAWASLLAGSMVSSGIGTVLQGVSASSRAIPDFTIGAAGAMGSPVALTTLGGGQTHAGLGTAAEVLFNVGGILAQGANMSLTIAGFERRAEDWAHEVQAAEVRIEQIDLLISAAEERIETLKREQVLAETELDNLETEGDYLESKFTNTQLYDWMVSRLSALHFQSYQLAYDVARQAEECYRFELGIFDTSFVQFGHWNSLRKGLLAGQHVTRDLKRMESAFRDQNSRALELTRHISLAQLDPVALHQLKTTGECFVTLPETLFDMDYPGHYNRRIKSVACTVPAVVGPYSGVNCTLALLEDETRISPSLDGGYAHAEDADGNFADDPRFISGLGGIQAIATSHGQGDSGLHRLDFRDERYLPFEGAGAISRWHIQMDQRTNRFDLDTITDFIIHLDYTARSGGDVLRDAAMSEVVEASPKQAVVGLSAAQDFAADWRRFLAPAGEGQSLSVTLDKRHLPWVYAEKEVDITSLTLVLNLKTSQDYEDYEAGAALSVDVTPPTGSAPAFLLEGDTSVNLRPTRIESFAPAKSLGDWTFALSEDALASISADLTISEEVGDASHLRLDPEKIADLTLLIGFEVS